MSAHGLKPGSHCARVLEVLADRQPHSITEIHARAGFMRLNSRVAELRKHGLDIVCTRVGDDYIYQLSESEPDTVGPRIAPSGKPETASAGASLRAFPVGQEGGSRAESPSAPSSPGASPRPESIHQSAANGEPPSLDAGPPDEPKVGSGYEAAHEQLSLGVAA